MSIFFFLWALLSVPTYTAKTNSTTSSATYGGGDRPPKKPVTPKKAVIIDVTTNK